MLALVLLWFCFMCGERWVFPPFANHPSDEDLSLGTPVEREGWAPIFVAGEAKLWDFDEFHLAVAFAVEDFESALVVAEDEDFAVAEFGFFYGLFQRHWPHGD
jgi:hypothetical protein